MKVQSSLMGVGGWYETLAAGWLADMRSKQVPTSTTSARRLAALSKLPFFLFLFAFYIYKYLYIYSLPIYIYCLLYYLSTLLLNFKLTQPLLYLSFNLYS